MVVYNKIKQGKIESNHLFQWTVIVLKKISTWNLSKLAMILCINKFAFECDELELKVSFKVD